MHVLISVLTITFVVTPQGLLRVFNDMTDIVLDVPNAYHTLSKFIERGALADNIGIPY